MVPQHPHRRGAVTVEFSMVITLFFLITFGTVEFSRINIIRHAIDNAAYESARVGIVPGATVAEVEAVAQFHLNAVQLTAATVTVTPNPLTAASDTVTVQISVPVAPNSWVMPNFSSGMTLDASSTLSTERYQGFQ
jgi:Flp pilus assembly protein TadG